MKILIIEDEIPAARRLQAMINEYDKTIEVLSIIQSVAEGIKWFSNNPVPDLIFSDIQLSDDLSFEIFKHIPAQVPVIFITAFDEYAINAFEYYSIDYILKPIKSDNLARSIQKFHKIKAKPEIDFDALLQKINQKEYRTRFLVYSGNCIMTLNTDEVAYIYSEGGLTTIHTLTGIKYIINETLDKLEPELNPKNFFRANRQYIITPAAISKIFKHFNQKLQIILKNAPNNEVLVSKLKATEFKKWLDY